jgi:hypothetical protein
MCGEGLITPASVLNLVTMDLADIVSDGPVYEYPKNFQRRKRISFLVLPALFYGALLVGILMAGPSVSSNSQLVLYMFLFLSGVLLFFLLLVQSSRPWILVYPHKVRVGGMEFPTNILQSVIVFMDRRMMFERPPYQLIFVVSYPDVGQVRITSEAIRNVQDVDTIVRDLRELLPHVEFVDRTLTGGSAVSSKMLENMASQPED